jgi:DHA2 family multidrug resistance protein-like MFS transporter
VLAVIYGLKQVAVAGLGWLPALAIGGGLIIGALFVRRQRTLADPFIDLGLFANRAFSGALAMYMLSILFAFGTFYFTGQYLQLVAGMSPLHAGLWSLPTAAAFIIGSNLAPRIVRQIRPGRVVTAGLAVAAIGLGMLTQVGVASLPLLLVGSFVMSVGISPVITLATDIIVGSAPPERAGAASGLSETSAELGGALGISVLGSIGTAIYRSQVMENLPADVPATAAAATRETLGGAVAAAGQLPDPLAAALLGTAREAFVQGLQLSALIGAAGLAGTSVLVAVLLRSVPTGDESEALADTANDDAPPEIARAA